MGIEAPPRRRLTLATATPTPWCVALAPVCGLTGCRLHLGREVEFKGAVYRCAAQVAAAFPRGLPPVAVAKIMGEPEGEVQRLERGVLAKRRGDFLGLRAASRIENPPPPPPARHSRPNPGPDPRQLGLFDEPAGLPAVDPDHAIALDTSGPVSSVALPVAVNRGAAALAHEALLAASVGLRLRGLHELGAVH